MPLKSYTRKITTAGGAGVAVGSATIGLDQPCRLEAVRIDYTSMPATTDVTLTNWGKTVYARANANADSFEQVRTAGVDQAGTALAAGDNRWTRQVLNGTLQIDVAQADAGAESVIVTVYVEV